MARKFFRLFGRIKPSMAQVRKGKNVYSGRYLNGEAVYWYDESAEGRIYNGSFKFTQSYYDFPNDKIKMSIRGLYRENNKTGVWNFTNRRNGESCELKVEYSNGQHNGIYQYKSVGKSNSINFKSGVSFLHITMHNGHPIGEIKGSFGNGHFKGFCDDMGVPDGTWSMDLSATPLCRMDYEVWENGTIKDSYSIDTSTGDRKPHTGTLVDLLSSYIYRECYKLEKIIEKGSSQWKGEILTRKTTETL